MNFTPPPKFVTGKILGDASEPIADPTAPMADDALTRKEAEMGRLTELLKRLESTPDVVRLNSFRPEILGDFTVGDLRRALSLESVREEDRPRAEVMHIAFLSKDRTDTEGYFARELVRLAERVQHAPARVAEGGQFAPAGHCAKRRADCWPCLTCWADNPSECKNP